MFAKNRKQNLVHELRPRRSQNVIFCIKWQFLSLAVPLTLKNITYLCVERYFKPLSKSLIKSDNLGHVDPKSWTFQCSPGTHPTFFFDQKLSFTHRGSYKMKKNHTHMVRCRVITDFVDFEMTLTNFLSKIHLTLNFFLSLFIFIIYQKIYSIIKTHFFIYIWPKSNFFTSV